MVVRARDLKAKAGDPEEVAIKMIRNNDTMYACFILLPFPVLQFPALISKILIFW